MEYFDDCVEEIGLDLEAKNIGLSYFNYAGDDVQIIADPEQLKRVIHNIILLGRYHKNRCILYFTNTFADLESVHARKHQV